MLYSKIGANVEVWQLGKVIGILQALTYLIKPLEDLTFFSRLRHEYDLDPIVSIVNRSHG